jgi:beta-glucosidase
MELSVFVVFVALVSLSVVISSVDHNNINTNYNRQDFPPAPHFVFGAGSSAYQIEGAASEDGRTASIWDTYAHDPSSQTAGNGDVAVDGYHKYKEDIQLMVKTGFEAYRFSISWSRLIPNGRGAINPKGLQYYNNFINELIANGIEPHVTLYHNDLPQVLQDEYGGWISPKSTRDFVGFADVCFREFGDRVKHWTTFNEPNAISLVGHDFGVMPPARCSSPFGNCREGNSSVEPYLATHNILLSHASASRLYNRRYKGKQNGMIGINLLAYWFEPYTNATLDILATQRALDYWIGWFLNPLVYGDYPETVKKNAGGRIPVFTENELTSVKGSLDFLTINHYDSFFVTDGSSNLLTENRDVAADMGANFIYPDGKPPPYESNIYTQGFRPLLAYVKNTYGNLPIYIHENGYRTLRSGDLDLDDQPRIDHIRAFIGNLLEAVRVDGSDVRGYFHWSFLDLYELLGVNASSYGLFYVDFNDKDFKRQPKKSAKWYSHFLTGSSSFGPEQVVHVEKNIYA